MRLHVLFHNSFTPICSVPLHLECISCPLCTAHLKHTWILSDNICECKEDLFQCFTAYVFRLGYWVVILHILEDLALLRCCAAQGGTDMLSLNINNQLLAYATQHPRRVKASTTPWRKPVISLHNIAGGYQRLRTTNWLHLQGWSD
jgi:hypothetical protein